MGYYDLLYKKQHGRTLPQRHQQGDYIAQYFYEATCDLKFLMAAFFERQLDGASIETGDDRCVMF